MENSVAQKSENTIMSTPVAEESQGSLYSRRDVLLTMFGVLLVMLLASLDQTIVATAMPRIIGEFNGLDHYTWVTTAYLLTSTVMVPIYGKLSDIFGRKSIFLIGVVLFLLGSALCGAAQSMNQLIAFRAFQGLGAAALLPIAMAVVGDLFTPRERGKWQGVTGSVFALSSILGPALGGWITENSTWRWVFYVNLPIGIIALLVLIFLMPTLYQKKESTRIDFTGAFLLAAGTVPLLLGLSEAGSLFDWLSWQTFALVGGGLVVLALFFVYEAYLERRRKQPIIEPGLFKNSVFSISIAITMITSMAMFGCIAFLPLYAQGVLGITATNSGLLLTPMMLSLMAMSIVSGQLVSRIGKYKWACVLGMIIAVIGTLFLLRLDVNSSYGDLIIAMIVLGLGLGFSMALYTMIVQNAWPDKIGQATSALTFFRQIGSTIALAAMGSMLSNIYTPAFHNALPASLKEMIPAKVINALDNPNILLNADAQHQLAAGFAKMGSQGQAILNQLMQAVKEGLTQGIHSIFVLSTGLMAIGLVIVFFLKEIELRSSRISVKKNASEAAIESDEAPVTVTMMH